MACARAAIQAPNAPAQHFDGQTPSSTRERQSACGALARCCSPRSGPRWSWGHGDTCEQEHHNQPKGVDLSPLTPPPAAKPRLPPTCCGLRAATTTLLPPSFLPSSLARPRPHTLAWSFARPPLPPPSLVSSSWRSRVWLRRGRAGTAHARPLARTRAQSTHDRMVASRPYDGPRAGMVLALQARGAPTRGDRGAGAKRCGLFLSRPARLWAGCRQQAGRPPTRAAWEGFPASVPDGAYSVGCFCRRALCREQ